MTAQVAAVAAVRTERGATAPRPERGGSPLRRDLPLAGLTSCPNLAARALGPKWIREIAVLWGALFLVTVVVRPLDRRSPVYFRYRIARSEADPDPPLRAIDGPPRQSSRSEQASLPSPGHRSPIASSATTCSRQRLPSACSARRPRHCPRRLQRRALVRRVRREPRPPRGRVGPAAARHTVGGDGVGEPRRSCARPRHVRRRRRTAPSRSQPPSSGSGATTGPRFELTSALRFAAPVSIIAAADQLLVNGARARRAGGMYERFPSRGHRLRRDDARSSTRVPLPGDRRVPAAEPHAAPGRERAQLREARGHAHVPRAAGGRRRDRRCAGARLDAMSLLFGFLQAGRNHGHLGAGGSLLPRGGDDLPGVLALHSAGRAAVGWGRGRGVLRHAVRCFARGPAQSHQCRVCGRDARRPGAARPDARGEGCAADENAGQRRRRRSAEADRGPNPASNVRGSAAGRAAMALRGEPRDRSAASAPLPLVFGRTPSFDYSLVDADALDAVVIATPSANAPWLALQALLAEKHVSSRSRSLSRPQMPSGW